MKRFRAHHWRVFAVVFVSIALIGSGCRQHTALAGIQRQRVDTLWYATSRQRINDRLGDKLSDSLEYGFYRLASRTDVDIMRDDIAMRVIDSARVSEASFLAGVAAPSTVSGNVVVLSVHGYASDHRKAIADAGEAYLRSGTRARWVAFSWPSGGRGLSIMEIGRSFLTSEYRADSTAAAQSKPAFAGLLLRLQGAVGGARLVVVTHSLGVQLATESLASDSLVRARLLQDPLRAVGLFEPDLSAQRFAEYTAPRLRTITRRLALYGASNDEMLRFSSMVNGSGRAGLLETASKAIDGVEIIDVTSGESAEDWFRRGLGTHHAMKRETGAMRDFFDIVVAGRKPTCRIRNGTAELRADNLWQLLPARAKSPC